MYNGWRNRSVTGAQQERIRIFHTVPGSTGVLEWPAYITIHRGYSHRRSSRRRRLQRNLCKETPALASWGTSTAASFSSQIAWRCIACHQHSDTELPLVFPSSGVPFQVKDTLCSQEWNEISRQHSHAPLFDEWPAGCCGSGCYAWCRIATSIGFLSPEPQPTCLGDCYTSHLVWIWISHLLQPVPLVGGVLHNAQAVLPVASTITSCCCCNSHSRRTKACIPVCPGLCY